ncbi:hypothetical protein HAX54_013791 [Datura stramonium]|uniref:Disease resistance protein winged helix domain-containing protein n=1 Tax=Datura stramonium TaxID=4076 RepID=A0ABS8TNW2_DATST|nr:hypothetical protein [Datura stramonium]
MKVIQLSYDCLEDHLKSCLLYMGLFPKGYEIPVSDLLKWWIAEEFVQNIDMLELEETSKSFLDDLVNRNLVVVSKRRASGEMKCCIVLDQRHVDISEFSITWEEDDEQVINLRTLGLCYVSVTDMTPKFWGKFPNLEELKLHIDVFGDITNYSVSDQLMRLEMFPGVLRFWEKIWDLNDNQFYRLKVLKLHRVFMTRWICSDESFPMLEKLIIKSCSKLEEIRWLWQIPTTELIKVIDCSDWVEISALNIEKEARRIWLGDPSSYLERTKDDAFLSSIWNVQKFKPLIYPSQKCFMIPQWEVAVSCGKIEPRRWTKESKLQNDAVKAHKTDIGLIIFVKFIVIDSAQTLALNSIYSSTGMPLLLMETTYATPSWTDRRKQVTVKAHKSRQQAASKG